MEYTRIELSEQQAGNLFTPESRCLLRLEGACVFAAVDDGNVQAALLITPSPGIKNGYLLSAIAPAITGDYRAVPGLIGYVENICRDGKIKYMGSKLIGNKDELKEIDSILKGLDYIPLSINGRFIEYSLGELKKTEFAGKFKEMEKYSKQVVPVNKADRMDSKAFFMENHKTRVYGDDVFSSFFIENGKIKCYTDIIRAAPDILLLSDIVRVAGEKIPIYGVPVMLAFALKKAWQEMPESSIFLMQLYSERLHKGILTIFGEPLKEQCISQYVKQL